MTRNVFLLTVDSLQEAFFAPYLSELAELTESVEFTNAVAPATHTSSSMPALAAGVYADNVSTWGLPEEGDQRTLAEVLSANGYSCGLWTDNFLFGAEYNYDRGFEAGNQGQASWKKRAANVVRSSPLEPAFGLFEYAYFNVFKPLSALGGDSDESFYRSAAELNEAALEWLDDGGSESQCCWIHYMDTHHPYEPPAAYLDDREFNREWSRSELGQFSRTVVKSNGEGYSAADIEDVTTAYEACCEYLADQLQSFIHSLIDRNHFDPSEDVMVITADHGECLSPEQYEVMGHMPPAFWEEIVHVPLTISHPDWERGTVERQVSLIDMLPTVLDGAGVRVPETVDGSPADEPTDMAREHAISVSQWESPETGDVYTYRSARDESGWKLSGTRYRDRNETILSEYDVTVPTDEEIRHISDNGSRPEKTDAAEWWSALDRVLTERGGAIESADGARPAAEVNEEHLRNLGYID